MPLPVAGARLALASVGTDGNESKLTKLRQSNLSGGLVTMKKVQIRHLKEAFSDIRYRIQREGPGSLFRLGWKMVKLWTLPQNTSEFDREFDTDTEKHVPLWRLKIDSANRQEGVRYQTLAPFLIRDAIEALPVRLEDFSFCDLGSGKGRTLMIASEYPFTRVVGVEFSAELNVVAGDNLRKYKSSKRICQEVSTFNMDAADFQFPPGNLMIFLFNPFGEIVLRGVLANLESALLQEKRTVWIIYFNAVLASLIEESGSFIRFDSSIPAVIFRHETT